MLKIIVTLLLMTVVSSAWFMPSLAYSHGEGNVDENYQRDDKKEVVIDIKNSKMFYDSTPTKKMHFIRAWSYCQKMDYLGKTDWKVPTKDESRKLLELSRPDLKSKHAFKNTKRERYWSSTEDRTDSGWYVDFDLGRYSTQEFTKLYRVICVRDNKED